MADCIAGLDIGGTNMKFGLVRDNGQLIWQTSAATPYGDVDALIELVVSMVEEARAHGSFDALGIGCPGFADTKAGIIRDVSNLALDEVRFKDLLEDRLGLQIKVINDVGAAMRAEQIYGVCQGMDHVVYVALGTGVGGGFIFDSKPYRGNKNLGAEIGHIVTHKDGRLCSCGMQGCFEQYASVSALVSMVKDALISSGRDLDAELVGGRQIFKSLREGDLVISEAYEAWLDELSTGLISLMALLAPQQIVIGGGLSNEGVYFEEAIIRALQRQEVYEKYYQDILIKTAKTGNNAGIIGAASLHL